MDSVLLKSPNDSALEECILKCIGAKNSVEEGIDESEKSQRIKNVLSNILTRTDLGSVNKLPETSFMDKATNLFTSITSSSTSTSEKLGGGIQNKTRKNKKHKRILPTKKQKK
jgi:hypothetical protein